MVVSELYTYLSNGDTSLGRMVRWKDWKFFTFSGFPDADVLLDAKNDPLEEHNLIGSHPEIVKKLKEKADSFKSYDEVMIHERWVMDQLRTLMKCDYDDPNERWIPPELPELEHPIQRKVPFSPTPWAVQMMKKLQ